MVKGSFYKRKRPIIWVNSAAIALIFFRVIVHIYNFLHNVGWMPERGCSLECVVSVRKRNDFVEAILEDAVSGKTDYVPKY